MFVRKHLIATLAVVGGLAAAGPVASAGAAQTGTAATPATTPGASIPCYPFPAFCDPSTGQPAVWAPWWVRSALGLPPLPLWAPFPLPPLSSIVPPVATGS